jgi:hypothetical protein
METRIINNSLMSIEEIANEEFKNVGDEGLFPNHTDKDIWMSGFKACADFFNINVSNKLININVIRPS